MGLPTLAYPLTIRNGGPWAAERVLSYAKPRSRGEVRFTGLSVSNKLRKNATRALFTVAAPNSCVCDTVALWVSISSLTGKPGTFAPLMESGFRFDVALR